jgi:cytosolic carboxypeptidase protein 6
VRRSNTARPVKRSWRHLIIGAATVGLLAVIAPGAASGTGQRTLCQGAGVAVEASFARAGARACSVRRVLGVTTVRLEIRPETTPINPSPWYAVRLVSRREQPVVITLDYGEHRHRYRPHVQPEGAAWQAVPSEQVVVDDDAHSAQINLRLPAGRTLLAAQPFEPVTQLTAGLDRHVTSGLLQRRVIGQSVAGLPILAYDTQPVDAQVSLVLLTRQHPPEVTGEWAFDAFTETVLGDTALARAFRDKVAIVMLPLINPDGIAGGYWRSNRGLVDLNRDWGPFTQPETRAASSHILSMVAQRPAIAVIDFHATNRDVIYAQPVSADLRPVGFVDRWLSAWTTSLGENAPEIDRGHNATQPTSKTWARLSLGVAAFTYEVGDNTPHTDAEDRARRAAEVFMAEALLLPELTGTLPNTIH